MSVFQAGTKLIYWNFPKLRGPPIELLVIKHDSIGKAYLVQRLGEAPKWEDEKSLRRLLGSKVEHLVEHPNELEANDPLVLAYSRYETSGGRARPAYDKDRAEAIKKFILSLLEQASDAEEDQQDDAPPTKRARSA